MSHEQQIAEKAAAHCTSHGERIKAIFPKDRPNRVCLDRYYFDQFLAYLIIDVLPGGTLQIHGTDSKLRALFAR